MAANGNDDWSEPTRVEPAYRNSDVDFARRGVASFGGGGPAFTDPVRQFVQRYGWRAYAIPILLAVSVIALLTTRSPGQAKVVAGASSSPTHATSSSAKRASSPPIAPPDIALKSDAVGPADDNQALANSALPSGGPYTTKGDGTYRVIKGTSKPIGSGRLYRYDVEVENGVTGVDVAGFASMVQATLSNSQSWSGHGVTVQRVDSGPVDFRVSLTSSLTVRQYCGYTIPVETSCYAAAGTGGLTVNRVVLNVARWVRGAPPYVGDLNAYRTYMINHEDGHAMGHIHAHQCLPDNLAPVMMQQTFGLKSAVTGKNCEANPWPYPTGVKGAPGAEQPDTRQNDEYYLGD